MSRLLGIGTTEFLAAYADNGGTTLRFGEEDGRCVFVTESGCRIHPRRPLVCRLYPLGRATDGTGEERFARFPRQEGCEAEFGTDGTIAEFLETQGVAPYLEWSLRYGEVYRRMLRLLDLVGVEGKVETDASGEAGPGEEPIPQPTVTRCRRGRTSTRRSPGIARRRGSPSRPGSTKRSTSILRPWASGSTASRLGSERPLIIPKERKSHELPRTGRVGKDGSQSRAPGHRFGVQGPGGRHRGGLRTRVQLFHLGHGHQGLRAGDARGPEGHRRQGAARPPCSGRLHIRPQQLHDRAHARAGAPERRPRPCRSPHPWIFREASAAPAHRRSAADEREGARAVRRHLQPQPEASRGAGRARTNSMSSTSGTTLPTAGPRSTSSRTSPKRPRSAPGPSSSPPPAGASS